MLRSIVPTEITRASSYCGQKGGYFSITEVHDKLCRKKILPCPTYGCTHTMERQYVDMHLAIECDFTVISCKYKRLGCYAELNRMDMRVHEVDDKLHLHMAIVT